MDQVAIPFDSTMKQLDLNCDLGEGFGNEAEIMPLISSCSIACGGHAGDRQTVAATIALAKTHHVQVGAHPSFPDRENFGRRPLELPLKILRRHLTEQTQIVFDECTAQQIPLNHIKAHGALYNLAARDPALAQVLLELTDDFSNQAIHSGDQKVALFVPAGSVLQTIAHEQNVPIKVEAFADRAYHLDLSLVSRDDPNAIISEIDFLTERLTEMFEKHHVQTIEGDWVSINANTFCVHGDQPHVVSLLRELNSRLESKGITIARTI